MKCSLWMAFGLSLMPPLFVVVWCKHVNSFLFCAQFCHGDLQNLSNLTVNFLPLFCVHLMCTWSIHLASSGARVMYIRCVCSILWGRQSYQRNVDITFHINAVLYFTHVLLPLYFLLPHWLPFLHALLELTGQLNRKTYFVLAICVLSLALTI